MIRTKTTLLLAALGLAGTGALADETGDMDSFYADESNLKGFEITVSTGKMAEGREKMITACRQAKQQKEALDCDCMQGELDKISDKEFFFESVLAFRQYRERVEALREKDQEKFERLKKAHAERLSLGKRIEQVCGKS